jgi:hypothetical protein
MNTILKNNIVELLISVVIWTVVLFFTAPILFVMAVAVFIGLLFSSLITDGIKQTQLFLKQTTKFILPVFIGFFVGYGVGEFLTVGFGLSMTTVYLVGCIVGSMYFNFYSKKL